MTDNLRAGDATVLNEIAEMQPISIPDVAHNLGVPPSTVRRAVRRLAGRGLVEADSYQRSTAVWSLANEEGHDDADH